MQVSRSQAWAQRRRQRLTWRRDLTIVLTVEGQEDDTDPLPELGRRRGGVFNGPEDVLLPFGDGDLGRLTRHAANLPDGCESSESREF
jgi:hypothetical protein